MFEILILETVYSNYVPKEVVALVFSFFSEDYLFLHIVISSNFVRI